MKENSGNSFLPILLTGGLAIGIFVGYFLIREKKVPTPDELRLREIITLIEQNYVDPVNGEVLLENALVGLVKGFPAERLVSKKALERCQILQKYGVVLYPGDQHFRVVNIFPGSITGIMGLTVGDRIQKIEQGERELSFELVHGGINKTEIHIPDSFAVFDQSVLSFEIDGSNERLLCLSPTLKELMDQIDSRQSQFSILDLRFFSNVGVVKQDYDPLFQDIDSIIEGPYTFGLGELVREHLENGEPIKAADFETKNFTLISSGGKSLPKSSRGSEDKGELFSSKVLFAKDVLEGFLKRATEIEFMEANSIGDIHDLDPEQHFHFYQGIRKNGVKKTYRPLL